MIKDKKMLNCKLFSQNHNSAEFQLILKCKKIGIEDASTTNLSFFGVVIINFQFQNEQDNSTVKGLQMLN